MRAMRSASDHDPPDPGFETRLLRWLRDEVGVEERRRLVRSDDSSVLVSKFEPGFAPRLHTLLDSLPEIFDQQAVVQAYALGAAHADARTTRIEVWHGALRGLLRRACAERGIDDDEQEAFVRVGIDSVRAVLEVVLWSSPTVEDGGYEPHRGELAAYRDATRHLASRDQFSRYYGAFEGRAVENHCPGAPFARTMLAQAWAVCTGTDPPDPAGALDEA